MENKLSLTNKTKIRIPRIPFLKIKDDILGKGYILSLAFVNPDESQKINKKYRNKNKPTNVLSFALHPRQGEIVLCPSVIKKESGYGTSKKQSEMNGKTFSELLGFLVIHGMLHLKGMQHSSTMEEAEEKYDKKYFYRNRRGHEYHSSRGGRISKRRRIS